MTNVGGQAVLEGVMMRGPSNWAVAVRKPDGDIAQVNQPIKSPMARHRIFRLPVIRGIVALGESLAIGFRALAISANYAAQDANADEKEEVETELSRGAIFFAFAIAIGFALALFKVTPALITNWLPIETDGLFVIVEGVIRVTIFVLYILVISLLPDLKRVFQYHAAEHKAINALEAGEELTPENVQRFSLIHPRCGTAFLLWVMVIAIFVFAFIGQPSWPWLIASRILLLPVIAGLAYEVIRFAGKHTDNRLLMAMLAPGLWLQRLTTREPSLDQLERKYRETQERMSDPAVYNDHREAAETGRRLKELEGPYKLAQEWRGVTEDLEAARDDGDLRELVPDLEARLAALEEELKRAHVETDPADSKDVILEVRQGVGGDEAALWAAEVLRMLTRYAERRGWKTETLGGSPNEFGGIKEMTIAVKGDGAYSVFKWEGGTHRVQRVPETESQGRIHTSTATVAVMPEAEEVEVEIDQNDLKIDVYRSTGPGGQSVNTTDSAVRITHVPTGVVVSMQDEKSQLQNRVKAMRVLRARLLEAALAEQQAVLSADRKAQVGTGERAEKIRTYNFPENRVTDHRVKLTAHRLEAVLGGELDEFTGALGDEERRRALEAAAV